MRLAASLAVAAAVAVPGARAEEAPHPPRPAVGAVVPDFTARDVDGKDFRLSAARSIGAEAALAAVLEAARARGAASPAAALAIDEVPGVAAPGAPAPARRRAFLNEAGRPFGLLASDEVAARLKTLGDVAAWVEASARAPIVFVIWGPRCPFVRAFDDRLQAAAADLGARLFAVSSNAKTDAGDVRAYVRDHGTPYRVLLDPDQAVCDLLGGRHTPEAVVLDATNAIRYRGAVDDDPREEKRPAQRAQFLRDAIAAVRDGRAVARPETTPVGCPVRRAASARSPQ